MSAKKMPGLYGRVDREQWLKRGNKILNDQSDYPRDEVIYRAHAGDYNLSRMPLSDIFIHTQDNKDFFIVKPRDMSFSVDLLPGTYFIAFYLFDMDLDADE